MQMAEIFKVSRQVYANYENEINQPSLLTLIMMADYFECSLDYLLGRSDDLGNINVLPDYSFQENFCAEERALFKIFRDLSAADKKLLLEYANFLQEKHGK
jgi:transcriptional regulator with XRE-family HTH domain